MDEKSGSLESLHPELQLLILLHISNIDALHSLINASPRFFQVYHSNKTNILSELAIAQTQYNAFSDAFDCVRAAQLIPYRTRSRESVLHYLKTLEEDESFKVPIIPLSVSIPLCHLGRDVKFWISDFILHTVPILAKVDKSRLATQVDAVYCPLSDTELTRLERSLYRFETFRHLFAESSDLNGMLFTATEQAHLFLEQFMPWEIEEVACIRDYFIRRLYRIFDEIEDEWVVTTLRDEKIGMLFIPTCCCCDRWEHEDRWYSRSAKSGQADYMEYLLSLGLPFLRQVIEATGEERRDLVTSKKREQKGFLTDALSQLRPETEENHNAMLWYYYGEKTEFDGDDADECNLGWLWGHGYRLCPDHADSSYKAFRDWGYVFWDCRRLEASGILSKDPKAEETRWAHEFTETGRFSEISVQERYEGRPPHERRPPSRNRYKVLLD